MELTKKEPVVSSMPEPPEAKSTPRRIAAPFVAGLEKGGMEGR